MATLGNTSEPTSTQEWSGGSTNSQVAHALTFPSGGPWRVKEIGLWLAGKDGSATIRGVVWSSDRNTVLGQTAAFTASSRSFGVGQNDNYEKVVSSEFVVNGGTTVYVGFYRSSGNSQWGRRSGSHYDDTATSGPQAMSGETLDSDGSIGAYLVYEADNQAPSVSSVTLENAISGSTLSNSDNLWWLSIYGDDDSGSAITAYDYQIDTTTGNGVVPDWASLTANVANATTGIGGHDVFATITHALTDGQWYALRARIKDAGGLYSAWSSPFYFKTNNNPTVASPTPADLALAYIWNIDSDLAVWTTGGTHAKPRVTFQYNDADGHGMTAYRVKIYNDSGGAKGTTLYDSGKTTLSKSAGATVTLDLPQALVLGTQYWWAVEVWDSIDESSGSVDSATARRFKVRWGQAIYEHNAGAGSSAWDFTAPAPANGYAGYIFASATGASGAGRSAWADDIGGVTPNAYLNVLVRLAPNTAGTNVTLADMTFSYLGSASTPDLWFTSGLGSIVLDPAIKRFGTQSLKVTTAASNGHIYPQRSPTTGLTDIDVTIGATYTFSAYVRTNGTIGGVRLVIRKDDGSILMDGAEQVASAVVTNTAAYPSSWQRLTATFAIPSGVSKIRPSIEYTGTTAGQVFWVDGVKLEEGTVASPWVPGFVADAVVLDANGVAIDGLAGGIFRLRGSGGTARDSIELGANGFLFGGDTVLSNPVADILRVSGPGSAEALQLSSDVQLERVSSGFAKLSNAAGVLGALLGKSAVLRAYSSSATWTKPADLAFALVLVQAGGGAGGGAAATAAGEASVGGGGAGGGCAWNLFSAAQLTGASYTVTVGAAKAGTSGAAGGAGNNSSFAGTGITTLEASGGGGGAIAAAGTARNVVAGGAGGGGVSGQIFTVPGDDGGTALRLSATADSQAIPSYGGGSFFGGISGAIGASGNGVSGSSYGGGGTGAYNQGSNVARTGGQGAGGLVVVIEFYGP